jgi:putative ABC transport system ATP-binding protein
MILLQLEKLAREHHRTVVIVTHTKEIAEMGDRVITMRDGHILSIRENASPISAERIEW